MLRPRQPAGSGSLSPPKSNSEPDTPLTHYGTGSRLHASSSFENLPSSSNSSPSNGPVDYFPNGLSGEENVRATGADLQQSQPLRRNSGGGSLGGKDGIKPLTGASSGSSPKDKSGVAQRRGQRSMSISLSDIGVGVGKGKRKGSRLGLSQRAWLIVTVILGLIILTKILFPTEISTSSLHSHAHSHDTHLLTPRDYLNNSRIDPAPFEFCPVFGPGDAIAARRGQMELLKSRLHVGTGARIQRVLQKAMSGAPITISILGGSISACQGAGGDPVGERCYPAKFFSWWNSIFPHPANELTNGATKKTDSAYYAYCNKHHLPDKADLVLLEFDAADPNDHEWLRHFELLVRSILLRPEMPGVIILGHFSPQVQAQNGFAGPELLHNVVAQFYDVPHISAKGVIYEHYLQSPDQARNSFFADPQHANPEGHDLIADVLISYLMSQICSGWSTLQGHSFEAPTLGSDSDGTANSPSLLGGVGLRKGIPGQKPGDGESASSALKDRYLGLQIPQMRVGDRPHDVANFREVDPFCVAASDLINPLPPSLFYGSGWHTYHPPESAQVEDRHYWYAEQPTARLRVPIKLGAGDVGVYFLQSPPDKPLGVVKCWVDDNYGGARELHGTAEVEEVIATLEMIDRGVSGGSHFVECQLQGEAGTTSPPFKILGLFTT